MILSCHMIHVWLTPVTTGYVLSVSLVEKCHLVSWRNFHFVSRLLNKLYIKLHACLYEMMLFILNEWNTSRHIQAWKNSAVKSTWTDLFDQSNIVESNNNFPFSYNFMVPDKIVYNYLQRHSTLLINICKISLKLLSVPSNYFRCQKLMFLNFLVMISFDDSKRNKNIENLIAKVILWLTLSSTTF